MNNASIKIPPGKEHNQFVASETIATIKALCSDEYTLIHCCNVFGLPGGYPCLINKNEIKLDLIGDISLEEAIHINLEGNKLDGIEKIEDNGDVIFTDKCNEIFKKSLNFDCKILKKDEWKIMEEELYEKFKEYQSKSKKYKITSFENYKNIHSTYKKIRKPIYCDYIKNIILKNKMLDNFIDIGCGTGNYLVEFKDIFNKLIGIDESTDMTSNIKDCNNINIINKNILDLPPLDIKSDVVLMCQVLHHLKLNEDNVLTKFFEYINNFMNKNGLLIINTSTPEQQKYGFWWASLIPKAIDKQKMNFPELSELDNALAKNFVKIEEKICIDHMQDEEIYFLNDINNIDKLMNSDSSWSYCNNIEKALVKKNIINMHKLGKLNKYIEDNDRKRFSIGQTTLLIYRKK